MKDKKMKRGKREKRRKAGKEEKTKRGKGGKERKGGKGGMTTRGKKRGKQDDLELDVSRTILRLTHTITNMKTIIAIMKALAGKFG